MNIRGVDMSHKTGGYRMPRVTKTSSLATFGKGLTFNQPRNLLQCSACDEVQDAPGVYVLLTGDGTLFQYPVGRSPVLYIGQSVNLRRRLGDHSEWAKQAKSNRRRELYYPRYEYAERFGVKFVYLCTRGRVAAKKLEKILLARFTNKFRGWPVGNSGGSWDHIGKVSSVRGLLRPRRGRGL